MYAKNFFAQKSLLKNEKRSEYESFYAICKQSFGFAELTVASMRMRK